MLPQDLKNYRAPWSWLRRNEDRILKYFSLLGMTFVLAALLMGCGSMPLDLIDHERLHCEGWSHTGESPFYVWTKTRSPSIKPWLYVKVDDIDRTCRELGTQAQEGHRINACAKWLPMNCVIFLPK